MYAPQTPCSTDPGGASTSCSSLLSSTVPQDFTVTLMGSWPELTVPFEVAGHLWWVAQDLLSADPWLTLLSSLLRAAGS